MAYLIVLQSFRAFDERVPSDDERDHEAVHVKRPRGAVVNGRLVTGCETQVVVDLIAKCEPEADVVELCSRRDTVSASLAAVVPGGVECPPETFHEVACQVRVQLEAWIGLQRLPDIVIVGSEEPHDGEQFDGCAPTRHPRTELPKDGHAQAPIPTM